MRKLQFPFAGHLEFARSSVLTIPVAAAVETTAVVSTDVNKIRS